MPRIRICIIGTGALGSLFAARLSAVAEICVLGTWQAQLSAMRDGLTLQTSDGSKQVIKIHATDSAETAGLFDGVLVLVKSYQTERSAPQISALLKPDASVLTLQNGLGNQEILEKAIGKKCVLAGITTQAAAVPEAGRVIDTGPGPILLGEDAEMHTQIEFWQTLFSQAGWEVRIDPDVMSLVWGKLVVNAAINIQTALLGVQNGILAERPDTQNLMKALAEETATVAAALGLQLPFADATAEPERIARATAANHSSMLADIRRGNGSEAEAIYGEIVRAGLRCGVPTPLNTRALELAKDLESKTRVPDASIDMTHLFEIQP